jgi:hypothetical protein
MVAAAQGLQSQGLESSLMACSLIDRQTGNKQYNKNK